MAESAANTVTSDHLWSELARLVAIVGLVNWGSSISQALWVDPSTTLEDVEDLVRGLRLDLLRLAAAASETKRCVCEALEVALGHLEVHEWAASTRPSIDEAGAGPVLELTPRPRAPDPVASRALEAARRGLDHARELVRRFEVLGGAG